MKRLFWCVLLTVLCITHTAEAGTEQNMEACFASAAQRYQVWEGLLRAIAYVESGMNPKALGKNPDGSEDIGLMQINSRWLPVLAEHGLRREDLFDPCVSAHVGAWILAQNIARHGNTWRAVGAYNAASESKRLKYVRRIASVMERPLGQPPTGPLTMKRPTLRVVGEKRS